MHRIDSHDATPDNKFTEGNPTIPVAATTVTAAWLNDAQENICQTIEGAGITLQKDAPGQLLTAVRNLGGEALWNDKQNYRNFALKFGLDGKLYLWLAPSGPNVDGVGVKAPGATGSEGFWLDFVASLVSAVPAGVPRGAVCPFYNVVFAGSDGRRPIFWGQTVADEGWVLADGGSDGAGGNVPNLKDRMIMGAGGSYAAGATGGAATHSHNVSGSAGGATLSVAQISSHNHAASMRVHYSGQGGEPDEAPMFDGRWLSSVPTQDTGWAGGSGSHSHGLSASASAANGLPPYYALALCVKI